MSFKAFDRLETRRLIIRRHRSEDLDAFSEFLADPAATAYLLVRSFPQVMAVGAALGALAAVVGLYLSFHVNLPSGPAMTLVATGAFVVVVATRRRAAI